MGRLGGRLGGSKAQVEGEMREGLDQVGQTSCHFHDLAGLGSHLSVVPQAVN